MNPVVLASIHHENILCNVTMTKEDFAKEMWGSLADWLQLQFFPISAAICHAIMVSKRPTDPRVLDC